MSKERLLVQIITLVYTISITMCHTIPEVSNPFSHGCTSDSMWHPVPSPWKEQVQDWLAREDANVSPLLARRFLALKHMELEGRPRVFYVSPSVTSDHRRRNIFSFKMPNISPSNIVRSELVVEIGGEQYRGLTVRTSVGRHLTSEIAGQTDEGLMINMTNVVTKHLDTNHLDLNIGLHFWNCTAQTEVFTKRFPFNIGLIIYSEFFMPFVNGSLDVYMQEDTTNGEEIRPDYAMRFERSIENENNETCGERNFTLNLDVFGVAFDHIIVPRVIETKICSGSCSYHLHNGRNTMFSDESRWRAYLYAENVNLRNQLSPVHCVPYRYTPITVLVQDTSSTSSTDIYRSFVVRNCMCR